MPTNDRTTAELLTALCDETISPDEMRRLDRLIVSDAEVRRQYLEYLDIHARLSCQFHQPVDALPAMPSAAAVDFAPLSTTNYPLSTPFVGGPVFSYMVATVVLCLMLLSAWAYKTTQVDHIAHNTPTKNHLIDRPEFVAVGYVSNMRNCSWMDSNTATIAGAKVSLGREYSLAAGLLEITYNSGAKVILEGPCEYKVDSRVGGYLGLGKLTARIDGAKPQAANPEPRTPSPETRNSSLTLRPSSLFTIRTPTAVVTDLGTEFGVDVGDDGSTFSHVFCGSVKVRVVGGSGGEVVLRADESAQVFGGSDGVGPRLAADVARAKLPKFITRMPPSDTRKASEDYAKLVLSMGPAAYYRMERSEDKQHRNILVDSSVAGRHGELLSDDPGASHFISGRWGEALRFRGPEFGDAVIVKDYPVITDDRLTVSTWVLADRWLDSWPQIACNWGYKQGQFHFGLFEEEYDLAVKVSQRNGEMMVLREEKQRFPLGRWQHVAFVVDGDEIRLYRNGAEVASAPCKGLLPDPVMKSLGIGCKTDDSGESVWGKHWHGMIDELAVFNKALSAEDISRLYEGNSSDAGPNGNPTEPAYGSMTERLRIDRNSLNVTLVLDRFESRTAINNRQLYLFCNPLIQETFIMLKIYRNAVVVLCLAAFVGVFVGSAAADFVYDFDTNVGEALNVGSVLDGQDNWVKKSSSPVLDVCVQSGATGWTEKYAENAAATGTQVVLWRENNPNWSFSLQDDQDFDISADFLRVAAGGVNVMGLDRNKGGGRNSWMVFGVNNGCASWWVREGDGTNYTHLVNYTETLPTATGIIYRIGLEVTANGSNQYDFQPYYQDLTTPNARVYANGGNPITVTFSSDLSGMFDMLYMRQQGFTTARLDNLQFSQVPEPSTLALLASGLIGLLAYAWRKRK